MHARSAVLRSVALIASTLASVSAASASADPGPTAAELDQARELFGTARRLEDDGRWPEALELFQRIAAVKLTPQVRFHLALCLENVGAWTAALDGFRGADEAARWSAPDVVNEAREHLRALEARVPTVRLRVTGDVSGVALLLDLRGVPLDGRPRRADPGPHVAELRRAGQPVGRAEFTLDPRTARTVDLRVAEAASLPPATPAHFASPLPDARSNTRALQRSLGWTALAVGGASAITTGVFVGLRAGARDRLDNACPTLTDCPAGVASIVREGKTDATLVNVFGALTGVAAATGLVLLVSAPPERAPAKPRSAALPRLSLAFTGAGFVVKGGF